MILTPARNIFCSLQGFDGETIKNFNLKAVGKDFTLAHEAGVI